MGQESNQSNLLVEKWPDVAATWHPTLNSDFDIKTIRAGSDKQYWWVCEKKHDYISTPLRRARGSGCPYCSNQKALSGFNDLETKFPAIAAQWDYSKNDDTIPSEVVPGSGRKYWWVCDLGHSFLQNVGMRTSRNLGCPYCGKQQLLTGYNDIATCNPEIAKEWHPTKNGNLLPSQVIDGSRKLYWWLCPQGHEYQTLPANRKKGSGCHYCSNYKVQAGFNDLQTTHPWLVEEWDSNRNEPQTPQTVVAGDNRKYFWLCPVGHSYEASLANRTSSSTQCPYCINQKVLSGFNDLETVSPEISKSWNFQKNGELKPSEVLAGSRKSYWWICDIGHEWKASCSTRQRSGCGICSGVVFLSGFNDLQTMRPDIASTWHPTKNEGLLARDVHFGTSRKYWWICPEGHAWKSSPEIRKAGSGCPTCAQGGYDSSQPGIFYFIKNSRLRARKVGITNQNVKTKRLSNFGSNGWEVITTITHDDGLLVKELETLMLRWIRKDLGLPPFLASQDMGTYGGHSETFSDEDPSEEVILNKIHEYLASLID
jgi:hypothetical protein